MDRSFYQFVLSFRGGKKGDEKSALLKLCLMITVFRKMKRLLIRFPAIWKKKLIQKCQALFSMNYMQCIKSAFNRAGTTIFIA